MLHRRRWDVLPGFSRQAHVTDQRQSLTCHDSSKILRAFVAVVLGLSFSIGQAWGEIGTEDKRAIVAAGFGYQIGTVSTIAVKVYDADSGDILSNETYELAVKESDGVRSNRGPRIFAGGVGLGATDLSNFVLRVYDANTGTFQWEGRLNLVQIKDSEVGVSLIANVVSGLFYLCLIVFGGRSLLSVGPEPMPLESRPPNPPSPS